MVAADCGLSQDARVRLDALGVASDCSFQSPTDCTGPAESERQERDAARACVSPLLIAADRRPDVTRRAAPSSQRLRLLRMMRRSQ
jgi:hypothetical protein